MTSELRGKLQDTLGGAYTLEHELGGGGMSRVFVAMETALGRKVVVKVMAPELAQDVSAERFRREIQMAAQLQQANIVPVLAAGELDGLPYYTMPLVDGRSLRARLTAGGALGITEAVSVLRDVAKALAYAHEHGVVHRDIKPDNVLLSGGTAVVTDFGVAKALSAARREGTQGTSLTAVGGSLGTPAYMAPEQAAGDPDTDHRADIYAFGIMAYELLAGEPPFHGRTPQRLLAAQLSEMPEAIGSVRPDTPPLLAELVMRCLRKEPDTRPQSAAELVRALETVTSGGSLPVVPEILLGGRRKLWRVLLLWLISTIGVSIVARAAIIAIGLPDWVFPGAVIVMMLGLPVILFTAFVHRGAHQALTQGALTADGRPASHPTWTRLALKASPFVSWRKTAVGGVLAVGAFAALVLGFMILRALGIGPAGSLLASGKLTERGRLVVTDFRVRGADTTLGAMITEAARTDLGQSSVVSVMSPEAIAQALARMERPPTTRIDVPLAREIAVREGAKAVVDGEIAPLGNGFVMAVRLIAADSGRELAAFRETADSPRELLPTIDHLIGKLRGRIGESLRAVNAAPPLEQVTTSSVEALKKYAEGVRSNDFEGNLPKSIALLQEAVALDTTFAMAYRKLGIAMDNALMPKIGVGSAFARAYRYRDRLPERERYLATAAYFDGGIRRDRARGAAAYEALLARDSLDDVAVNNYANILFERGEYARADSLYRRNIQSGVAGWFEYSSLVGTSIRLGKPIVAESIALVGMRKFPEANTPTQLANALYALGQVDSAGSVLRRHRSNTHDAAFRTFATHNLAQLTLLRGRLAESQQLQEDYANQDRARGAARIDIADAMDSAFVDIWFREKAAKGAQALDAALSHRPLRSLPDFQRPYFDLATLYALAGRADRARAILAEYDADVSDSLLRRSWEPVWHNARAEVALAEHRPLDALKEFRLGDRLPDGPANPCRECFSALQGRAFDQANMVDSTIAMYEAYLALPRAFRFGELSDATYLAGIEKRLGELYEAKGARAKAAQHYAHFVEMWRNADAELQPKVADVRRRLERLGKVEK